MQYFYCTINTNMIIGVDIMKKRITFTLDEKIIDELKELSEKTMIPQARLVEQAIKNLLEEYKEK